MYGSNKGEHGVPQNLLLVRPDFRGDSVNSGNVIVEPFGAVNHGFLGRLELRHFFLPVKFFVGREPEYCSGKVGLAQ